MLGLKCLNCEGINYDIKNQTIKVKNIEFEVEATICTQCGADYSTSEQMNEALKKFRLVKEQAKEAKKYEIRTR